MVIALRHLEAQPAAEIEPQTLHARLARDRPGERAKRSEEHLVIAIHRPP